MSFLKPGDSGYTFYGDPWHKNQDINTTLSANPGIAKGDLMKNIGGSAGVGVGSSLAVKIGAHFIPVLGQIPGLSEGIGWAVNAALGHFQKLGRDKKSATTAANIMHSAVWNDIMPMYKAGQVTREQAEAAINEVKGQYTSYLKELGKKDAKVAFNSMDQLDWLDKGLSGQDFGNKNTYGKGSAWDIYSPGDQPKTPVDTPSGVETPTDKPGADSWDWLTTGESDWDKITAPTGSSPTALGQASKAPTPSRTGAFSQLSGGWGKGYTSTFGQMARKKNSFIQPKDYDPFGYQPPVNY
jgi:hypothetical protein